MGESGPAGEKVGAKLLSAFSVATTTISLSKQTNHIYELPFFKQDFGVGRKRQRRKLLLNLCVI